MTHKQRLLRFRDRTGLTNEQLAEIFGVALGTFDCWIQGRQNMAVEFQKTLLRIEGDHLAALSPQLKPETIAAFRAGMRG